MSDIDLLLYRPIKNGNEYEKLIPKSTCKSTYLGKGMTDFSIREMADMVKQYAGHMEKVAPLLRKSSLQRTCNAIHEFAYNHFQYKADKETQLLRSPACSWHVRYDGIDCKSYSIVASCILASLGISHYIRRIKQPGFFPDQWTHVYVVVPNDQKTGNLAKGYYTIDGTVATTQEGVFIEKDDLFMSMEHYGLAAPHFANAHGLGRSVGLGISLNDIKGLFSGGWSPSCIGGTHDSNDFNATVATIVPWFDDLFYQINQAIRDNSPQVMTLVNKLMTNAAQIQSHSANYASYDWNSSCSKGATKAYKELGQYYFDIVTKAFLPWLETYFNTSYKTVSGINRGSYEPASKFTKTNFSSVPISVQNLASLTLKPTTTDIKRFEMTAYVAKSKDMSGFNVGTFIQGLTTTLASFGKPSSGNNSGGGTTNTGDGGTLDQYNPAEAKVQTAGFGTVVGIIVVCAGLGVMFMKSPDKPQKALNAPEATVKPKKRSKTKKSTKKIKA